jgi:putative peptide zinc metalloprotease protein
MPTQTGLETIQSHPKLKSRIEFFPLDGRLYHVFDPTTSKHFRMGEQEVQWLQLLDGTRSKETLRDHIPLEYFDRFFANAAGLKLLEDSTPKRDFDIFKMKLPISNPNKVLGQARHLTVLYRCWVSRLSPLLFVLNIAGLLMAGRKAIDSLGSFHFSVSILAFYVAATLLMGFCHELSHSIVAKSYGVNVPAIGMMLLYLHPSFYADVSGIRLLRHRGHRINVLLAGAMANNLLATGSLLVYVLAPHAARTYPLYFACMNLFVILMNFVPFVEYDGYYILQELLNEPDLAARARQSLRNGFQRFDYLLYFLLSQAFVIGLIVSVFIGLRRYALHFVHATYLNYICSALMIAALASVTVRTSRKVAKP